MRGSNPTVISRFNSSPGKESRLTEPESGFTAASHASSGDMAMAEADTPAPSNVAPVVGAVGGVNVCVDLGAQDDSARTATIIKEKIPFFMFHSPLRTFNQSNAE